MYGIVTVMGRAIREETRGRLGLTGFVTVTVPLEIAIT
jgi:hypothetical protein